MKPPVGRDFMNALIGGALVHTWLQAARRNEHSIMAASRTVNDLRRHWTVNWQSCRARLVQLVPTLPRLTPN